jgi:4-hydroxy-tetrahydrodipicolinate synthase
LPVVSGVYVPTLTAFDASGRIDPGGCAAHARWLVEAGVDGLVPFGSSGEGPSLSVPEKLDALDALAAALPGTPLVPAVTEASLDTALTLVASLNDRDLAAIMLLPAYYYRPATLDGLRSFLSPVVEASRHPVLIYHIPEFGPAVPVPLVAELPVWGVKDSGGDLSYTLDILAAGRQVMVGAEHTIVDAIEAGGAGAIPGLANVLPEHMVATVAAAQAGDGGTAREILAAALQFRTDLFAALGPLEWLSALKLLAQSRHGVNLGAARAPMPAAPADLADRLGSRLFELLAVLDAGQPA